MLRYATEWRRWVPDTKECVHHGERMVALWWPPGGPLKAPSVSRLAQHANVPRAKGRWNGNIINLARASALWVIILSQAFSARFGFVVRRCGVLWPFFVRTFEICILGSTLAHARIDFPDTKDAGTTHARCKLVCIRLFVWEGVVYYQNWRLKSQDYVWRLASLLCGTVCCAEI